ncbi:SGNH/GDSL hydrolase family protein [uncultured Shewanella sp.]|uniref:SGNH/GDSL hydrolase family protein n=1 Tax=uncultured Shewanella sp. TaxID=173975 RepID=UPI0026178ED7|nr:SGNH/GDSL hydrolase family protein [uncultured Shewanella sp.]
MKTILIYGDSLTWGFVPNGFDTKTMVCQRHLKADRWAEQLAALLGEDYQVIIEGLNGRTTVFDDPLLPGRNGLTYLLPCLLSHHPIDLVMIMLGSNDLKRHLSLEARDVAFGMRNLICQIKLANVGPNGTVPKILIICPPVIQGGVGVFAASFMGAENKSHDLPENYRLISELEDCGFFDSNHVIHSSHLDGVHLDKVQNTRLAKALLPTINTLLNS